MARQAAKLAGLVAVVTVFAWALNGERGPAWNMALIYGGPLLAIPLAAAGRRALDARPSVRRAEWITIPVHYGVGTALGSGLLAGLPLLIARPAISRPGVREVVLVLVYATGAAVLLSVLNLAIRGLGAPFVVKLSSRLATDRMYAWTRNPMVLATLSWFLSLVIWRQSAWGVVWLAGSFAPALLFFVRVYEERELQIRFGPSYDEYRARTPFLWPRSPARRAT